MASEGPTTCLGDSQLWDAGPPPGQGKDQGWNRSRTSEEGPPQHSFPGRGCSGFCWGGREGMGIDLRV